MKKVLIATALVLSFSACHKWDGKTLYFKEEEEKDNIDHNWGTIGRDEEGRRRPIRNATMAVGQDDKKN